MTMSVEPESTNLPNDIRIITKSVVPADRSLPTLVLQVIHLVNSYMVWVGVASSQNEDARVTVNHGNLCRDWACGMPTITPNIPAPSTSLFRTAGNDVALSMSQRLARKHKKQIFLSVDIPPSFMDLGLGPRTVLEAEKNVNEVIKQLEDGASA